jgi:hypothetical protein
MKFFYLKKNLTFYLVIFGIFATCMSAGDQVTAESFSYVNYNVDLIKQLSWTMMFNVAIDGNYAYCAMTYGLMIVDINNPSSPAFVSKLELPSRWASMGVAAAGDFAYVVNNEGLHIIDVTDPYAPELKSTFSLVGSGFDVVIEGDLAYVGAAGLQIVNIANAEAPYLVGSYYTYEYFRGIAVVDSLVYAASGDSELYRGRLFIINVSDPENPAVEGYHFTDNEGFAVDVAGDYAYMMQIGGPGLLIFNVSDPQNPTLAASYYVSGEDVEVDDTIAYVAGDELQILSVADPENPAPISSYDTPGDPYAVTLSGDFAYVADLAGGLQIVDIADPQNPSREGSFIPPAEALGLAVDSNYVYVVGQGLKVLEMRYGYHPFLIGSCDLPGSAMRVAVDVRNNDYQCIIAGCALC